MNPAFPPKYPIVGTPISITTFDEVRELMATPRTDRATVVTVCNVHSVMTARKQPALSQVLRQSDIATPDGMPLVWGLRAFGHSQRERVYGPELMRRALVDQKSTHRHFLFGSTPETLGKLQAVVIQLNPDVHIVGTLAPPFRSLTQSEEEGVLKEIRRSGANIISVGHG